MKKYIIILVALLAIATSSVYFSTAQDSTLYQLTVPETELVGQFHGDPINADLRLLMVGNQFLVMDLLVEEFQQQYPEIENVFYVTIPPGKELKWILSGGIEIKSEGSLHPSGFQLRVLPDVYSTVNKVHMDKLNDAGLITRYYTYTHNRLALMAASTDPLAGQCLTAQEFYDLMSDPTVTISEPDILTQGIERHIWQMYTDTSKVVFPLDPTIQALNPKMFDPTNLVNDPINSLRRIVYYDKVNAGKTLLTEIHHLETPDYIRAGVARLGPVWITEILFQQNRLGNTDLDAIEICDVGPDGKYLDRREKVNYLVTIVEGTMDPNNKQAALDWIEFLRSEEAQDILEGVGFIRATADELAEPFIYPDSESFKRIGEY